MLKRMFAEHYRSARPQEETADAIGRVSVSSFRLVDRHPYPVLVVVLLVYYNFLEQSLDCDK